MSLFKQKGAGHESVSYGINNTRPSKSERRMFAKSSSLVFIGPI